MTQSRTVNQDQEYKESIKDFFDEFADTWDDRFESTKASVYFKEKRLSILRRYLGDDWTTLLEPGCGTAYHMLRLLEPGKKGLGIDVSERMLERARALHAQTHPELDLEFRIDDGENLSLDGDIFDRVVFVGYLIHLQSPERAVAELLRVLKPGGRVVGLISNRWSPWLWAGLRKVTAKDYGVLERDQEFSPPKARRMFEAAGFVNVRLKVFNSLPGKLPDWAYYPGRILNSVFSVWPISQLGFHITVIAEKPKQT